MHRRSMTSPSSEETRDLLLSPAVKIQHSVYSHPSVSVGTDSRTSPGYQTPGMLSPLHKMAYYLHITCICM